MTGLELQWVFKPGRTSASVLLLLGCLALFPLSTSAEAAGGSQPLTASASACDANRLRGLLERSAVSGGGTERGIILTLAASGSFQGLAYTSDSSGIETHLWFSSNAEETTLLRSPDRPQLSTFSLTRNEPNSDLIGRDGAGPVDLVLNPTLDQPSLDPSALIAINNGPRTAAAKPGRGLDPLRHPCHEGYGDQDEHLLAVLLKVVRAQIDDQQQAKIAIYRGPEPHVHRLDVLVEGTGGTPLGQLAAKLTVTYEGPRPKSGRLEVLPNCADARTVNCSDTEVPVEIQLRTPASRGEPSSRFVMVSASQTTAEFDFEPLLIDTSWSSPTMSADDASFVGNLAPPILWIGAHPDDEVLLAPLLGELCLELGLDCTFLVATRGEAGRCLLPNGCAPNLGDIRSQEMASSAAAFGADLVQWDLPDGSSPNPFGVRATWAAASGGDTSLVQRLVDIIDGGEFGTVITFDPDHGTTRHADHRALGGLALDALELLGPDSPRALILETLFSDDGQTLRFDPSGPGLTSLNSNRWMVRLGNNAWCYLLRTARLHPSQFDQAFLARLDAVPEANRRIWLTEL